MRVSTKRVADLFGVTPKTVDRWSDLGILRPEGHGKYSFDPLDLLACALARDLRARGFSLSQCAVIADWLRAKGLAALQIEWKQGRQYLLSVGSAEPFPRQWTYGEIFHNEKLPLAEAFRRQLPIAVIDVATAFEQLQEKLAQSEGVAR